MARYKDPEERLKDIEDAVMDIKHTVDSMQRRAIIMTILRLIRLAIIVGIILWVWQGIKPFIDDIAVASIKAQEAAESAQEFQEKGQSALENLQGFFGVDSATSTGE